VNLVRLARLAGEVASTHPTVGHLRRAVLLDAEGRAGDALNQRVVAELAVLVGVGVGGTVEVADACFVKVGELHELAVLDDGGLTGVDEGRDAVGVRATVHHLQVAEAVPDAAVYDGGGGIDGKAGRGQGNPRAASRQVAAQVHADEVTAVLADRKGGGERMRGVGGHEQHVVAVAGHGGVGFGKVGEEPSLPFRVVLDDVGELVVVGVARRANHEDSTDSRAHGGDSPKEELAPA